jgi:1-acyl-sn-glycerol-3-phosphate acyltransferase
VNHASYIDIPVLAAALDHPIAFIYKRELEKIPVWGWLLKISPHVAINRAEGREALQTIDATARDIREGHMSVVVFPEGTRTATGGMGEFKRGGFLLATRTGVPVVPIGIAGTHAILSRDDWRVRPGRVDVHIGEPVSVPVGVSRPEEKRILEEVRGQLELLTAGATI